MITKTKETGTVFLVGSGPGGLSMMTIRAREVIDAADVILYDQLPGEEVLSSLPQSAERIDVGKYGSVHIKEQDEIEELMIRYAKNGKNIVRLKGGDPFLFGRGGEELESLREQGIPVEVIPGITSAIAVPASVGIPVTHRAHASQVTFLTGNEDPTKKESVIDWKWLSGSPGTIVILMGVKNLKKIADALIENGKNPDTPVAVIERGFRPDQRETIGTLANIGEKAEKTGVKPPAIIVIGSVVTLYDPDAERIVRP